MKRILPIAVIILVGCKKPLPEPMIVKVPVPIECPKVVLPQRPALPMVVDGDDVATTVKKMAVGIALLVDYSRQLETLLGPYSRPGATNVPDGLPQQPGQRQASSNRNAGGRVESRD